MLKPDCITPRIKGDYHTSVHCSTSNPNHAGCCLAETARSTVSSVQQYIEKRKNSPGLTLRLEEGKNVVDTDGALDVTDDRTRSVVHELNADLGDTTTRAGTAEDL